MKCPFCGVENEPGALFCASCGSALDRGGGSSGEVSGSRKRIGYVFGTSTTPQPPSSAGTERTAAVRPVVGGGKGLLDPPSGGGEEGGTTRPGAPRAGDARDAAGSYLPPELDAPVPSPPPPVEQGPVAETPGAQETQAIAAGAAGARAAPAEDKVICPECYAANPSRNRYCYECGSPLPLLGGGRTQAPPAAGGGAGKTAVLVETPTPPVEKPAEERGKKKEKGTVKKPGPADVLALFAVAAAGVAVTPLFAWKRAGGSSIFSHQGAFSAGRVEALGGPGLLPYEGTEFLTVGLVVAVALGLVLIFMVLRTGRGPAYMIAGCLLLVPIAYLFFQAVLPLRQSGVNIQPAPGLTTLFGGGGAFPGLGPAVWLITGAGLVLILAGFLAPPRGWGRLFTFVFFLSLAVGAAFFCAACYNWNLFISESPGFSCPAVYALPPW